MYELLLRAADWWLGTAVGGGLVLLVGCVLMRRPVSRRRGSGWASCRPRGACSSPGLRLLPSWLPPVFPPLDLGAARRSAATSRRPRSRSDAAGPGAGIRAGHGSGRLRSWPTRRITPHRRTGPGGGAAAQPGRGTTSRPWPWPRTCWSRRRSPPAGCSASGRCGRLLRQARPAAPRVRRLVHGDGGRAPFGRCRDSAAELGGCGPRSASACGGRPCCCPSRWSDAADAELRWVFAHELTHLRRRDPWSSWGFGLAQAVYFFLPWFWWVRRQVRLCQEYVADAAAAGAGPAADEYAEFLVSLARGTAVPLGATGLGSSSDLLRRVQMLLQPSTRVQGSWPAGPVAPGGRRAAGGGRPRRRRRPAGRGAARTSKKPREKKVIVLRRDDGDDKPIVAHDGDVATRTESEAPRHGPTWSTTTTRTTRRAKEEGRKEDGSQETDADRRRHRRRPDRGPVRRQGRDRPEGRRRRFARPAKRRPRPGRKIKERDKAIEKALELLKGELNDDQIRQLKKHLEEIRAQHGRRSMPGRTGTKARAAARARRPVPIWKRPGRRSRRPTRRSSARASMPSNCISRSKRQRNRRMADRAWPAWRHDGAIQGAGPQAFAFAATGGRLGVQGQEAERRPGRPARPAEGAGPGRSSKSSKDSAAAKAGLKTNDIILELAGKPVASDPGRSLATVRETQGGRRNRRHRASQGPQGKGRQYQAAGSEKGRAGMMWKQIDADGGEASGNLKWK